MSEQTIFSAFERAGYSAAHDSKGRHFCGMVRLLGGLEGMALLRERYMLDLFSNAQLRKGTAFTYKQLQSIANPREHTDRFRQQMLTLVDCDVFFRGYRLQCPACHLDSWYALEEVNEGVLCQGCRTRFQMPLELDFAYRLNRLFAEGLRQGALSVLLAALLLDGARCESLAWLPGLTLERNGETIDVDLAALCDGDLLLVECKDNFDDGETGDIADQVSRLLDVARAVKASRFLFATLREDVPDSLAALLHESGPVDARLLLRSALLAGD